MARLGKLDDPASVQRGAVVLLRSLGDGGWAVGEQFMEAPLLRYAADGRLVGEIGSVGDGPLEYRYLEALTHGPGDSLWLSNASGRIVIIAPDGNVARQIRTGGQDIDAFDPRGYSAELFYRRAADRVTWVSATVWSPSGDSVSVLGPGGAPENVDLRSVGGLAQPVALIDSTRALVGWPGSGPTGEASHFLFELTGRSARPLLTKHDVWRRVEVVRNDSVQAGSGTWAIIADRAEDRIWGISTYDRDEEGMMKGLLWVTDLTGELLAATSIDGNPMGFADPSHYYTMDEQPSGLVVINVWHHQLECVA